MQSFFGWWYESALYTSSANSMQKRLAEDSFSLSWTWNIFGVRYLYHRMGMGYDAADMMRVSLNNEGTWSGGNYPFKFTAVGFGNGPYGGGLFMNHMGDPALRLFMFAPPTHLSIVKSGGKSLAVMDGIHRTRDSRLPCLSLGHPGWTLHPAHLRSAGRNELCGCLGFKRHPRLHGAGGAPRNHRLGHLF